MQRLQHWAHSYRSPERRLALLMSVGCGAVVTLLLFGGTSTSGGRSPSEQIHRAVYLNIQVFDGIKQLKGQHERPSTPEGQQKYQLGKPEAEAHVARPNRPDILRLSKFHEFQHEERVTRLHQIRLLAKLASIKGLVCHLDESNLCVACICRAHRWSPGPDTCISSRPEAVHRARHSPNSRATVAQICLESGRGSATGQGTFPRGP